MGVDDGVALGARDALRDVEAGLDDDTTFWVTEPHPAKTSTPKRQTTPVVVIRPIVT